MSYLYCPTLGFLSGHSDYYTHLTGNYKETFMIGYDLMENDRPANISRYNGTYSTHLFANKVKDIILKQESRKVCHDKSKTVQVQLCSVTRPLQIFTLMTLIISISIIIFEHYKIRLSGR